jgi:YggT family protein
MGLAAAILSLVAQVYLLLLLARLVLELVSAFARSWRPHGFGAVAAEIVYTTTDPPLRLARRFIPPLRLGAVSLDLAFAVVLLAVSIVASALSQYSWYWGR